MCRLFRGFQRTDRHCRQPIFPRVRCRYGATLPRRSGFVKPQASKTSPAPDPNNSPSPSDLPSPENVVLKKDASGRTIIEINTKAEAAFNLDWNTKDSIVTRCVRCRTGLLGLRVSHRQQQFRVPGAGYLKTLEGSAAGFSDKGVHFSAKRSTDGTRKTATIILDPVVRDLRIKVGDKDYTVSAEEIRAVSSQGIELSAEGPPRFQAKSADDSRLLSMPRLPTNGSNPVVSQPRKDESPPSQSKKEDSTASSKPLPRETDSTNSRSEQSSFPAAPATDISPERSAKLSQARKTVRDAMLEIGSAVIELKNLGLITRASEHHTLWVRRQQNKQTGRYDGQALVGYREPGKEGSRWVDTKLEEVNAELALKVSAALDRINHTIQGLQPQNPNLPPVHKTELPHVLGTYHLPSGDGRSAFVSYDTTGVTITHDLAQLPAWQKSVIVESLKSGLKNSTPGEPPQLRNLLSVQVENEDLDSSSLPAWLDSKGKIVLQAGETLYRYDLRLKGEKADEKAKGKLEDRDDWQDVRP